MSAVPTIEELAEIHAAQYPQYATEIRQIATERRAIVNLCLAFDALDDRMDDMTFTLATELRRTISRAVRDRAEYIETAITADERYRNHERTHVDPTRDKAESTWIRGVDDVI